VALAEDLEHWLKHEPIQARRSGILARGRKWVRRKPAITALIASLVAFAASMGWIIWKSEPISRPSPAVANGIAVLPFENLSPHPDSAYLADGIQEEILTRLESASLFLTAQLPVSFRFISDHTWHVVTYVRTFSEVDDVS
jgi:hypothetical protein